MSEPTSRFLDELAVRSLPADETIALDGWLLRSSPSLPFRRVNSVTPFQPDDGHAVGLTDRVDTAEEFYRQRGQSPLIQVIPSAEPGLDEALATRRWEVEAPVTVMWAPLGEMAMRSVTRLPSGRGMEGTTSTDSLRTVDWMSSDLDALARLDAYERLLRAAGVDGQTLVTQGTAGQPVGVGHAVRDGQWVGIFGMRTAPEARRQGVATALVLALAGDAANVWLQVELDNAPARALYDSLGFRESHRYHYRRAPA